MPLSPTVARDPAELEWTCDGCAQKVLPLGPYTLPFREHSFYVPRRYCPCEHGQALKDRAREQDRTEQIWHMFREAGLTVGKLVNFTFANWDDGRNPPSAQAAREKVWAFTDDVQRRGRNWLYLHGPYGLGKTHLAVAALRKIVIERLWRPQMVVWPAHCSAVQQSWNWRDSPGPSEGQLWGQMLGADILLIDDIDKKRMTAWASEKLYEVIESRQMRERPTIITANRSLDDLQTYWGNTGGKDAEHIRDSCAAVFSRIVGQLWGTVEFAGLDQRWER